MLAFQKMSLPTNRLIKIIVIIGYLCLFVFQIFSTRIATVFEYSGLEKSIISQRPYNFIDPPQFVRFREYLFSSIKLTPLLVLGIYAFIRKPIKLVVILIITSLILLGLIGPNGKFGPLILLPFNYFLSIYALTLFKK